jgi:hypothetical protein
MTPCGLADVYINIVDEPAITIFKAQNAGSYPPNGMNISGELNVEYRTDYPTEYDTALSVRHF